MSQTTSSPAYGIGIITIVIGLSVGLGYYQMYYLPEQSAKPSVAEFILEPVSETIIKIIPGSALEEQQDNFVPKLVNIQLGIDNHVTWINDDDVAHTVTPDHRSDGCHQRISPHRWCQLLPLVTRHRGAVRRNSWGGLGISVSLA
ncbi:MAG: hypothetical protein ACE10E_03160 [Acidiferrobacterales bacterium]